MTNRAHRNVIFGWRGGGERGGGESITGSPGGHRGMGPRQHKDHEPGLCGGSVVTIVGISAIHR